MLRPLSCLLSLILRNTKGRPECFCPSRGGIRVSGFLGWALFLFASPTSADVTKCLIDGKVVYQASPCPTGAARSSVRTWTSTPDAAEAASTRTRLLDHAAAIDHANALRAKDRDIEASEKDIAALQAAMDAEISTLRARKRLANNNLAGATWEQSISSEMQALSERYRIKIDLARDRLTQLRKERATLAAAGSSARQH